MKIGKCGGLSKEKIHDVWRDMKARCYNPKVQRYNRYGGRGIKVCDRWRDSFLDFYADMGDIPFGGAQLDRIDNDGDYSPSNCRWVSKKENIRKTSRSVMWEFDGLHMCVADWADRTGIKSITLRMRVRNYGWSIERALTEGAYVGKNQTHRSAA